MKRVIIVLALGFFLFTLSVSAVLAQDSSGSSAREKFMEKREEKLDQFQQKREAMKDKFASKASDLKEKRREKIKQVFSRILVHFGKANERLTKISDKIQTRLDKIKSKGIDTSNWQAALDVCRQNKSSVEAAIANAKSKIDAANEQTAQNATQVKEAREAVVGVKDELHNYRKCLVGVMREIKAAKDLRGASESAN